MRYGKIDFDYALDLGTRTTDNDGPIYMVNFMKYRAVADYVEANSMNNGRQAISGIEADNLYNPVDVLTRIGAEIVFVGSVVDQGAAGEWDRMAIVKYASRVSFIEMQNRQDFKDKHVHKEAGMEYTIVMGTTPAVPHQAIARATYCTFRLTAATQVRLASDSVACLCVEGTIMGDGRAWSELTMTWSDEIPVLAELARAGDEMCVVAKIELDRMGKALTA